MYDPVLGRMLSPDNYVPDPLFTQDYNRYTYARNNPLVYTDPDGNFWNFVIGGVMGGVSGWQIGKAQGAKGWGMFGYILGGATIGVATAGIGQGIATATSSWGAIGSGISTGAGAGFIGGGLNAVLAGNDPRTGAAKGAVWGAAIGGALGVVNAAIGANKTIGELAFDSNNLDLTGKSVDFTRDSFDNFLNETGLDPDAVNTRTYLSSERVPSGLGLDEKSQFFTKQMNGETKYIAGVVREGSFAQRLVSNKTSTFIAAGAFRSDKYLYLVTGHEFIHAYHASLGINIWDGSSNTQFSERSAYGWSIMASKSINYPYSLNTFRSHWNSFNFKLSGAPSGRFHWKFVPGIIKR